MSATGWDHLSQDKRAAVADALQTLGHADLEFVLVVNAPAGAGAVLSNVEPGRAGRQLEAALKAARDNGPATVVIETRPQ